jgi:hypothetical protein
MERWGGWLFLLAVIALCILMPMTPSVPVWTASGPTDSIVLPPPGAHPMQIINCELACGCFKHTPEGLTAPE